MTLEADQLPALSQALTGYIREQEIDLSSKSSLAIDEELHLTELTLETLKSFDRLSPFGMDNKKPVFLVRNFKVEGARSMGAGNTHLKLKISQEDATFEVVAFGLGSLEAEFAQAQDLELAVQLSVNQWNGQTTLQLSWLMRVWMVCSSLISALKMPASPQVFPFLILLKNCQI